MTPAAATALAPTAVDQYLLPAPKLYSGKAVDIDRWPVCSKPAARRCRCRSTGQTDGKTSYRYLDAHRSLSNKPKNKPSGSSSSSDNGANSNASNIAPRVNKQMCIQKAV